MRAKKQKKTLTLKSKKMAFKLFAFQEQIKTGSRTNYDFFDNRNLIWENWIIYLVKFYSVGKSER